MRSRRLLLLSILIALFTSISVYFYIRKEQSRSGRLIPKVKILVAAKPIPAREIVEKDMIRYEEIPYSPIVDKIVQKEDDVLGKVATQAILAGEALYKDKFIEKGAQAGLSFIIPYGKRAVTIFVNNATGVAGLLKPGDFVDVISTFDVPQTQIEGEQRPPISMSITLLQNVQILALDTVTEVSPQQDASSKPPSYTMVTLAISPKDAEKLALLAEKSINRLALRPVKDSAIYQTSGVRLDMLGRIKDIPREKTTLKKDSKRVYTTTFLENIKPPSLPHLSAEEKMSSSKEEIQIEVIKGVNIEKVEVK